VDKCNIYDLDYSLLSKLAMERGEKAEAFMSGSQMKTKNCTKFVFDDADFESSIVTDVSIYSIVCLKKNQDFVPTSMERPRARPRARPLKFEKNTDFFNGFFKEIF
jgi:hypothetical protein